MAFKTVGVRTRRASELVQRLEARVYMSAAPVGDEDDPLHEMGLPPVAAPVTDGTGGQVASGPLSPLTSIPVLNSDPGATATLYLDFHGEGSQPWGGTTVPATPAYTADADATTFSGQELANIAEIWSRVSEAYSPFNINVTTVDPGSWNLAGTGSANRQVRVVIGGAGAWTNQLMGGIAYVGAYTSSYLPNTGYVFSTNLGNGAPQYTADDAAHEAGHLFGLQHQSTYSGSTKTAEYNTGNGTTAPFMGNPLSPTVRATWWDGQSSQNYLLIQDDVSILSGPFDGIGYRTLPYGQSTAGATTLALASDGSFSNAGIIETTSQKDYFTFVTSASGTDTFDVNVAQYGAMLHARLELHDASDNALVAAAAAGTLSQTITATLPAGRYYLVVKSYGQYGDIGQYTVSGAVSGAAAVAPPSVAISGSATGTAGAAYALSLAAVDAGHTVSGWTINWGDGTAPQALAGNPAGVNHVFAGAGNFTIAATMSDDAGTFAATSVAVAVTVNTLGSTNPPGDNGGQLNVLVQPVPVVIGVLPVKGRKRVAGKFRGTGASSLYQFTLSQQQVVVLRLNGGKPGLALELMDSEGNEIWGKSGRRVVTTTLTLAAGTYELQCSYLGVKATNFSMVEVTKPVKVVKSKRRTAV